MKSTAFSRFCHTPTKSVVPSTHLSATLPCPVIASRELLQGLINAVLLADLMSATCFSAVGALSVLFILVLRYLTLFYR